MMTKKGTIALVEAVILISVVVLVFSGGTLMAGNVMNMFAGERGAPWDIGTYDSFDRLLDELVELLDEPGAYKYNEHIPFTLGPRFAVAGFGKEIDSIPMYYADVFYLTGTGLERDDIKLMRTTPWFGDVVPRTQGYIASSAQPFPRPAVCPPDVSCLCLISIKGDIWDTLSERASNFEQLFRSIGDDLGATGYPAERYDIDGARCHFFEEDIIFYSVAEDVTPFFPEGFSDPQHGFNPRLLSYGLPYSTVEVDKFYVDLEESSSVKIQPNYLFFGGMRPYAIDDGSLGRKPVIPSHFLRFFGSRNLFIDIVDLENTVGDDETKFILVTPHRGYNYTAVVHEHTTLDDLFLESFYNPVPEAHKELLSYLMHRDASAIQNKLVSTMYSDIEKLGIFVDYMEWAAHPLLHTAEQFNSTMRALQPDALQRIADIVQRTENACRDDTLCDTKFIACDNDDAFCHDINERLGLFFTDGVRHGAHSTCLVEFRLAGIELLGPRDYCPPVSELLARLAVWRVPEARSEIALDTFLISRMEQKKDYEGAFSYFKEHYIEREGYTLVGVREHFPQFASAFAVMREPLRISFSLPDAELYFALFDDGASYLFSNQDYEVSSSAEPLDDVYGRMSGLLMDASYDRSGRLRPISAELVRVYPYELDMQALMYDDIRSVIGFSLGLSADEMFARRALAFYTNRANKEQVYTYLALQEIVSDDFVPFEDFTYTAKLYELSRAYNESIADGDYKDAFEILEEALALELNDRYPQHLNELHTYVAFLKQYFPESEMALGLHFAFLDGEGIHVSDDADDVAFCYVAHNENAYLTATRGSLTLDKIYGTVSQLTLSYVENRDTEDHPFYHQLDQLFSLQTYQITTPSQHLASFVLWESCTEGAS